MGNVSWDVQSQVEFFIRYRPVARWPEVEQVRATEIEQKLDIFALLKVDRKITASRDFNREDLENKAKKLLQTLEDSLIGASAPEQTEE